MSEIDVEIERLKSLDKFSFGDLLSLMDVLRVGCPWDKEQTHASIRQSMLEEAYEACDAIDNNDCDNLCEELGDLLLQVVFHSKIADEANEFNIDDVIDEICKKMIVRHPHIFSDVVADNSNEVLKNWDIIKAKTKGQNSKDTVKDVPKALPALMRSQKIIKRAHKAGLYEYPEYEDDKSKDDVAKDISNKIFELCAVAQSLGIDLEEALSQKNTEFLKNI